MSSKFENLETRLVQNDNAAIFWSDLSLAVQILVPIALVALLFSKKIKIQPTINYVSGLWPSVTQKQRLLTWLIDKIPYATTIPKRISEFWKDGSLLCTLINTVIPGACPNPQRHWKQPPIHAQALAYKYFGLEPVLTSSEFNDKKLTTTDESKFCNYLISLQEAISKMTIDTESLKFTSKYLARGMGLIIGEQNKPSTFYLYPNIDVQKLDDIHISIKGPYNSYGKRCLSSIELSKNAKRLAKLRREAENDCRKLTFTSKTQKLFFKPIFGYVLPKYEKTGDISIETTMEKDRAKISFVPKHSGIYELLLICSDEHIYGSPFIIRVIKNCEEKTNCDKNIADKIICKNLGFIDEAVDIDEKNKIFLKLDQNNNQSNNEDNKENKTNNEKVAIHNAASMEILQIKELENGLSTLILAEKEIKIGNDANEGNFDEDKEFERIYNENLCENDHNFKETEKNGDEIQRTFENSEENSVKNAEHENEKNSKTEEIQKNEFETLNNQENILIESLNGTIKNKNNIDFEIKNDVQRKFSSPNDNTFLNEIQKQNEENESFELEKTGSNFSAKLNSDDSMQRGDYSLQCDYSMHYESDDDDLSEITTKNNSEISEDVLKNESCSLLTKELNASRTSLTGNDEKCDEKKENMEKESDDEESSLKLVNDSGFVSCTTSIKDLRELFETPRKPSPILKNIAQEVETPKYDSILPGEEQISNQKVVKVVQNFTSHQDSLDLNDSIDENFSGVNVFEMKLMYERKIQETNPPDWNKSQYSRINRGLIKKSKLDFTQSMPNLTIGKHDYDNESFLSYDDKTNEFLMQFKEKKQFWDRLVEDGSCVSLNSNVPSMENNFKLKYDQKINNTLSLNNINSNDKTKIMSKSFVEKNEEENSKIFDRIKMFDHNFNSEKRNSLLKKTKKPVIPLSLHQSVKNSTGLEDIHDLMHDLPVNEEDINFMEESRKRFESARHYFRSIEQIHLLTNSNNQFKKSEPKRSVSLKALNVHDRFSLDNLYRDVTFNKLLRNGSSLKGSPNREGLVETLASISSTESGLERDFGDEEDIDLGYFQLRKRPKRRKSVKSLFDHLNY